MVALFVLGLGILGLAGVQTRMLVESRTGNYRAIAVGLIDDLNNRMLLNRAAAIDATGSKYALAWDAAATAVKDCVTNSCSGTDLAQSDLNQWRDALGKALPGGIASIFVSPTDPLQIGIAVGWNANEGKAADVDSAKYHAPFTVTAANAGVDCPTSSICHFVYVRP
jgi:type IV pilus assembly protein PilV